MGFSKFVEPIEFKLTDTFSWGIEFNRFGEGYSISLKLDPETKSAIEHLAVAHDTNNPIYGAQTLYLKFYSISETQKLMLNAGRCYVNINFEVTGVFVRHDQDKKYLVFKVTGLGKSDQTHEDPTPEDL